MLALYLLSSSADPAQQSRGRLYRPTYIPPPRAPAQTPVRRLYINPPPPPHDLPPPRSAVRNMCSPRVAGADRRAPCAPAVGPRVAGNRRPDGHMGYARRAAVLYRAQPYMVVNHGGGDRIGHCAEPTRDGKLICPACFEI